MHTERINDRLINKIEACNSVHCPSFQNSNILRSNGYVHDAMFEESI